MGCVVLITAFWSVLSHFKSETRRLAVLEAQATARNASVIFGERVGATIATVDGLMRVTARDLINNPAGTTLKDLVAENGFAAKDLVLLSLTDQTGRMRETDRGPAEPISLADREHIRVHLDHPVTKEGRDLYIGKPVLGRVSKKWSIQLTRAVTNADGSLYGILVASLDPYYFEKFWQKLELSSTDRITLVGLDGVVRMQSEDVEAALSAGATRRDIVERSGAAPSGLASEVDAQGTRYVAFDFKLPDFPLIVSTRISEAAVLAAADASTDFLTGIGVLMAVVISGLGAGLAVAVEGLRKRREEAQQLAADLERQVERRTKELAEAVQTLKTISTTDSLTRMPNRRAFDSRLKRQIANLSRYGTPFALILFDVDHFKSFNDTFGHSVGDTVLIGIGRRLRSIVREDDLAARVGGEEFGIILPQTDARDALAFAERLRLSFARRPIAGHPITVTVGVTQARAGDSAATIYRRADTALYSGKKSGRNLVVSGEDGTEEVAEA